MEEGRTKRTARNLVWGVAFRVLNMALPFLIRTIVIYTLGTLYLGLDGLFTSVLEVLNLTELGIASAIVYSMYEPLAKGETAKVCALLNFYRRCYRIIGLVVAIAGLLLLPFLPHLITGKVPADINIYLLYLMHLTGTVLTYELFAYRTSLLNATQRNDVVSKVNFVCYLCRCALQIVALLAFHSYYLYVIVNIFNALANNVAAAAMSRKMFPQYHCTGEVAPEVVQDIWKKVKGMVCQKIGNVVLMSVDTLVISSFLGLHSLALYQNYYVIFMGVATLFGVIQTAMMAPVGNAIATDSVAKNYEDFKKFNFLYLFLGTWASICLLCLYQPFVSVWLGPELMLPDYLAALLALCFFTFRWCDMSMIYQYAKGLWWETRWVPLLAGIINLTINLVLVQFIGLAGIVISTIASILLVYDTGVIYAVFNRYFHSVDSIWHYWRRQILYLPVVFVVAFIIWQLAVLMPWTGMSLLLARLLLCILLTPILLWGFWWRREECRLARAFLSPMLKKCLRKD